MMGRFWSGQERRLTRPGKSSIVYIKLWIAPTLAGALR